MKILNLSFEDKISGLKIDNVSFSKLTLLVGASGVGKTKIIECISLLIRICNGSSINGVSWKVQFQIHNEIYEWGGSFITDESNPSVFNAEPQKFFSDKKTSYPIDYEYIKKSVLPDSISVFSSSFDLSSLHYEDKDNRLFKNSILLLDRTSERILYQNKETVKLDNSKSVIALLKEELDIKKIYESFHNIQLIRYRDMTSFFLLNEQLKISSVSDLKKYYSPVAKLYLIYKAKLPVFNEIENSFKAIFPFVEKIHFDLHRIDENSFLPILKIKEHGEKYYISQNSISSGMLVTLEHLTVINTALNGDIILVDEFENSLGVNCLEDVTDLFRLSDKNLQFIFTSHHPYIINSIDSKYWKIVVRKGGVISVKNAQDLGIGTQSKHDLFIQLLQSPMYKNI